MAFATKRGRPKQPKSTTDFGTPELMAKRGAGITREPLDLCLDKRLITPAQHWCGLHLRWLYTLRYGAPGVSCRAYHLHASTSLHPDDPEWRLAREQEYKEAIALLQAVKTYEAVMGLCVFHDVPSFLNHKLLSAAPRNAALASKIDHSYQQVKDGLEALSRLWKR